jgi:hypothetical protein
MAKELNEEEKEALDLLKGKKEKKEECEKKDENVEEIEETEEEEESLGGFLPEIRRESVSPILPVSKEKRLEREIENVPVRKEEEKKEGRIESFQPSYGGRGYEENKGAEREEILKFEGKKESMPKMFERKPVEMIETQGGGGCGMPEKMLKYESKPFHEPGPPFMKKEELKKYKRR